MKETPSVVLSIIECISFNLNNYPPPKQVKIPLFFENKGYFHQKRRCFHQKKREIICLYEKNAYICIE